MVYVISNFKIMKFQILNYFPSLAESVFIVKKIAGE